MSKLQKQKILIELDCLLDTRIGTIAMMGDELATQVLNNGYHTREEDWFEGIDNDKFKELYARRDIETLKYSTITTFLPLLKHLCNLIYEEAISRPYHSGPEVYVNIYPYYMTGDTANYISSAIKHWVGSTADIHIVRTEPKDMVPRFCKEYALIVMYNPTEWFNLHVPEMIRNHLRDITLYIPQIYQNKKPSEQELSKIENETINPFIALEIIMKTLIDVTLLDVSFFSIIDPNQSMDFNEFKLARDHQTAS